VASLAGRLSRIRYCADSSPQLVGTEYVQRGMRSNLVELIQRASIAVAMLVSAVAVTPTASAAVRSSTVSNHHCRNEQALYATKYLVIAREMTDASDIYVTCWRKTNKHLVVAKFPAEDRQDVALRARGAWVVWRYRTMSTTTFDHMGSINARTGRHGPRVIVPVADPNTPARLTKTDGPVAQDLGDGDPMRVFIASNGYYAWPVVGQLPDDESGQSATAMYVATGRGSDARIDVDPGPNALSKITISGTTLRWINNGAAKRARLGP